MSVLSFGALTKFVKTRGAIQSALYDFAATSARSPDLTVFAF
jgi:hypothetical protein